MFKLRKLEKRIAFDGAGMSEMLDEIVEHDQHDLEVHMRTLKAQISAGNSDLDIDTPLTLADNSGALESEDLEFIDGGIEDGSAKSSPCCVGPSQPLKS